MIVQLRGETVLATFFGRRWLLAIAAIAGVLALAACGSSSKSNSKSSSKSSTGSSSTSGGGSAAATGSPIKIGLITDLSGPLATNFVDASNDFKARLAYQNSMGGVDGHKLVPIIVDDASTPQGNLAAARTLVNSDHVAIVAEDSAVTAGAAPFLHGVNEPVVGDPISGPEWGLYSNMFSDWGILDPKLPAYTTPGLILKALGATSLGTVGYGAIPSSKAGTENAAKAAIAVGLKAPYVNTSVQLGSNDYSTQALGLKNAGVDSLYAPLGIQGDVALMTAAKQAGAKIKYGDFVSGSYGILGTPAQQTLQGSAFALYFLPSAFHTSVSQQVNTILHKFGGAPGRPEYDFDLTGWLDANLAITALQGDHAGTSASAIIGALRNVSNYTAGGLLPSGVSYKAPSTSTDLGANGCLFALRLQGSSFVPLQKTPFCGKKL
jgi:branched-chain amino acid transport system substrate-binding protein